MFEALCVAQAVLSTVPYETHRGMGETIGCTRDFEIGLLVGLTELKAQIAWTDSLCNCKVSLSCLSPFLISLICGCRGWRRFEMWFPEPLVLKVKFNLQEPCRGCIRQPRGEDRLKRLSRLSRLSNRFYLSCKYRCDISSRNHHERAVYWTGGNE